MKILFICKHNRFRSKVAEAIFNSLNKNPKHKSNSAGLMLDELRPYIEKKVLKILNKKRCIIQKQKPTQLTRELARKFDLIIIISNDIQKEFFKNVGPKIEKWSIKDPGAESITEIEKIVNRIEKRVKQLINNLKK